MSSKYKGPFKKGDRVWVIMHRNDRSEPDFTRQYQIRTIGPKQSIIDSVDMKTNTLDNWGGRAYGSTYRLETEEIARRYNEERNYSFTPWNWDQIFMPVGEAGWDLPFNV